MSDSTSQAANRRNSLRRSPKEGLRIACRRGPNAEGPDLALALLDASQTGLRLLLRETLPPAEEVALLLQAPDSTTPLLRGGKVMWAVPMADGSCCVGVQFHRRLLYKELLALTTLA